MKEVAVKSHAVHEGVVPRIGIGRCRKNSSTHNRLWLALARNLVSAPPSLNELSFYANLMGFQYHKWTHNLPRTPQRTTAQEQDSQYPPTASLLGISLASRYNYNLTVLRKQDPSIISIFDQFSHVCIYHHDG